MKIAVLTDPDTATGFRLGGLEVHPAADADEAKARLAEMIESNDFALIAVDEGLLPEPYEAVERVMRGRDLPVLLPFTSLAQAFAAGEEDATEYMRRLVKSTIGYDIKL
ncbi:MAG TPA: V-type ATP synthase subunit F [Oceanithermus profundus]|uniref:V-type ATP synthase subunit F n=1 Tax=Oceanithermus profundus TaxID=187137 RepID=A0A7C4V633_9DEIN|nr:V-type ATP synthase subunit F [Oceanithermus profundus]